MNAAGSTTTSVTTGDTLGAYVPAPEYSARSTWEPLARVDVRSAAVPPLSVTVPSEADPSKNATESSGVPLPAVTVAVSATDWPIIEGLGDTVKVVAVGQPTVSRKATPPPLAPPPVVVP